MSIVSRAQSRFLALADRLSLLGPTLARLTLGVIFIVMIIFLPQGLLGFARRWLNR